MKNVVLARIDERLIHGQVMTGWIKMCSANVILVIDDASAANAFLKRILFAAAPKDCELLVHTTKEAIEYLKGDSDQEKVLVLAKTPGPFLEAIKVGVTFKEFNLGNMDGGPGRKRFNKNVNASDEEVAEFKAIVDAGVPIYMQMVPSDSKVDTKSLL